MPRFFLLSLLTLTITYSGYCQSPLLQPTWNAHGGLSRWKSMGSVTYDCSMRLGGLQLDDQQTFDLKNRDGLITGSRYRIGCKAGEVWFESEPDALPLPPRFYLWTPFYFWALPFVMADPGVQLEQRPDAVFEGRSYKVVHASFKPGTGDAPDDYYTLYIDPDTHRLKLAVYIVTYPGLRRTNPDGSTPESAIVYDEWQEVEGLSIPAKTRLFHWENGNPAGEAKGTIEYKAVVLTEKRPKSTFFQQN